MPQIPVSLQLYTVRNEMAQDLAGTLQYVANVGYTSVESPGLNGVPASEFKKLLDDNNLTCPNAHASIDSLEGDAFAKTVEDFKLLGVETVVVPYLPNDRRVGSEGYKQSAHLLNSFAQQLKNEGFDTAYHNHNFEFTDPIDGDKTGFQILVDETDPALFNFEFDTYWALQAGQDPVAILKQLGARATLLHIKDMDSEDKTYAPLGTGLLPLSDIVQVANSLGTVKYLIVEQDEATKQTPLEAIKISYDHLKQTGVV